MFVGIDLHKNYLQVATKDDKGKVLQKGRIINNMNQISRFFRNINPTAKVVMESSCVWYNNYEYLYDEKKLDVVLSNPLKTGHYCVMKERGEYFCLLLSSPVLLLLRYHQVML
jgi:transposase